MGCPKCVTGLIIKKKLLSTQGYVVFLSCLNCGFLIDEVMIRNKEKQKNLFTLSL